MRAKPLKGGFSTHFYKLLRSEGIKPRRLNKPKGAGKFAVSVASSKIPKLKDLYYDPRALRNLDNAVELLPEIKPRLERIFELVLEHEKTHLGASRHYSAFSAWKIRKISDALKRKQDTSGLLAEQVANKALVAKIMRNNGIKSLESTDALKIIPEELSWVLIDASIRHGELQQVIKKGVKEAGARQIKARLNVVRFLLKQWFPNLPAIIIAETVGSFQKHYNALVEKAIQRSPRISIA